MTLTFDPLKNYLWQAADILRNTVDSSDFKGYIFAFIFLKRLSDRFEEEVAEYVKQGEPEDRVRTDPDYHQFFVPEEASWAAIQRQSHGRGEGLNKATAALEDANPSLVGVLQGIDFNDETKLGDARQRDGLLGRLIAHFTQIDLSNANFPPDNPDVLGDAYMYLIEKFAIDAGKKGGEFFTPPQVRRLLARILDPKPGMRIYDPACGSGGMLIECAARVAEKTGVRLGKKGVLDLTLAGQEMNLGNWAMCKMNLLLHSLPDADIQKGDVLRDPKHIEAGQIMRFDRVIANPPFSQDHWGKDDAEHDPYNRFKYGLPPKDKGDLAFVQHMVASLNDTGKLGVVMPHGVLFRGAGDGRIRKGLLDDDLIEAVIGLPENLFYGTGIPAVLLIINKAKPKDRQKKVLLIHAAEGFESAPRQNKLRDRDLDRIVAAYKAFQDEERYCRIVDFKEIKENDYNLNISRYVDTLEPEEPIDVGAALAELRRLEAERATVAAELDVLLKELGYV